MIVERNHILLKIQERLAGRLNDAALAAWAYDRFYAIDQGVEHIADPDIDVIADVLDELMFADEEPFALTEADFQRLIARLE